MSGHFTIRPDRASGRQPGSQNAENPGLPTGNRDFRYCYTVTSVNGCWWRGWDLNPRPSGYEPDELPDCSTPRREKRTYHLGARSRPPLRRMPSWPGLAWPGLGKAPTAVGTLHLSGRVPTDRPAYRAVVVVVEPVVEAVGVVVVEPEVVVVVVEPEVVGVTEPPVSCWTSCRLDSSVWMSVW
jgi:hypothetical protein